ncbi:hypothetical protein JD844_033085 [Phrynosoma platyrhinos]|uniref:Regulatory factor X-associated protein RFXANK-binding domain-containing protein n=1 Tax=Phrynosoma platyrhinos TaxID=52577 RepID=A0ABQ7T5P4_PHRPL|nr:hypothetical protein JD844_033085 [Phrynosoma platyrhinos]
MQPCGGEGEAAAAAAVGAFLQQPPPAPQVLRPVQAASEAQPPPPSAQGGLMLFYELGPATEAEGEAGESAGSPGGGGGGGGGLQDPDEEEESGGGCKSCTYEGCSETTTQVAKQRKPWMCKRHRNKMYKDKIALKVQFQYQSKEQEMLEIDQQNLRF